MKYKAQKDNIGSIYDFFQAHFWITYMQARTTKVSRQQKSAKQKQGGGRGHHKIKLLLLIFIIVWILHPPSPPPPQQTRKVSNCLGGPPNDNFLLDQIGNPKVGGAGGGEEGRRLMGLFVGPKDWKTMQPDKLILGAVIDQIGQPNHDNTQVQTRISTLWMIHFSWVNHHRSSSLRSPTPKKPLVNAWFTHPHNDFQSCVVTSSQSGSKPTYNMIRQAPTPK